MPPSSPDAYSFQSVFMGDVLFTEDVTHIGISVLVSDTDITFSRQVAAGTWFATPLHLIQYLLWGINTAVTSVLGDMPTTAAVDTDPDSATYGKITITTEWGTTGEAYVTLTIGDTAIANECGLAADVTSFSLIDSPGQTITFPYATTYLFTPRWPIHSYSREVRAGTGYAAMARDGTVYSFSGNRREIVNLGVTLDRRDGDYAEVTAWRRLWNKRWAAGRAVAFYLDRDNIQASWDLGDELQEADALMLDEAPSRMSARRLIDWKEYADQQDAHTFILRPNEGVDRENNPSATPEA